MSENGSVSTTKNVPSILGYPVIVSIPYEDEDVIEMLKFHWTSEQLMEYFQRKVGYFDGIQDKTKKCQAEQVRSIFSIAANTNAVYEKIERGFTDGTALHICFSFSDFKDLSEFNKIVEVYVDALLEE
jgi:tyrosyl-tRNA synthetase